MALSRVKTWIAGEVLNASDLNTEFNNILNNPMSLISPITSGLDLDGNTLTLDGAAVTQLVSSAAVSFDFTSGNKSGTPGSKGSVANWGAQTFTDTNTSGSGTATQWFAFAYKQPTLAAQNSSVTTTDSATVYIENAPAAGSNQTLTNTYALWIDDGKIRLDPTSDIVSAAGAKNDAILINPATATISGSTGISTATGVNLVSIGQPTLSAANALTVTNAATVYIADAPTGAGAGPCTITNAYALWVDGGAVRFDGAVTMNSTLGVGAITSTGASSFEDITADSLTLNDLNAIIIEGTDDAHETTISFADPTQDNTINIPDRDVDLNDLLTMPDVDASVASNALTATLNPCVLGFRSATLTDGTPVIRDITSALTVTAPSGATLGTISGQKSKIMILAIDNAGTVELAVMNIEDGTTLNEQGVISTTAIDVNSDTTGVAYSDTARTDVAYRVVGFIESTQATAGTWATAPALVQAAFGNAVSAMDSLGFGQVFSAPSRSAGTTYYNTTGKPIFIFIRTNSAANATIQLDVSGTTVEHHHTASANNAIHTVSAIVPPGSSYLCTVTTFTISGWVELS